MKKKKDHPEQGKKERHKHEEQPKPTKPTKVVPDTGELDSDGDSTNLSEDSNPNNDPDGPPKAPTNG